MLVTYVSTSQESGYRGFTANYEAVCGGDVELDGIGHLESPNYPEEYQSSKECIWRLTVPQDYQVALKFQSFEIENDDSCVYDYVEVRDGHNLDSPLIGLYCGYKAPPDLRSSGNKLFVKFVSDGSVQKAGFSATVMKGKVLKLINFLTSQYFASSSVSFIMLVKYRKKKTGKKFRIGLNLKVIKL